MGKRNSEGYNDPTANLAVSKVYNVDKERFKALMSTIDYICGLAGFRVEGELTLVDTYTGKMWRK